MAQQPVGDLLLYWDRDREPAGVTAYNPATGEKIELPVFTEVREIQTNGEGWIAYVQDNDVWVLDVLNAPNTPINVSQTPDEEESWLSWAPDGQTLEFRAGGGPYILYSYDGTELLAVDYGENVSRYWNENGWYVAADNDRTDTSGWSTIHRSGNRWHVTSLEYDPVGVGDIGWYVWNGQTRLDLTLPVLADEIMWQTLHWTPNNHLFITVGYDVGRDMEWEPYGRTDMYYWNGQDVYEVERPNDDQEFKLGPPSDSGRLLLYTNSISSRYDSWYIWDGVSFTADGVPDTSTFTLINQANEYIEDVEWLPDERLVIVAEGLGESDWLLPFHECSQHCAQQVYIWDDSDLMQVTHDEHGGYRVDIHHNGQIAAKSFGAGRFFGVTIYDVDVQPIFHMASKGFNSRWGNDGSLAYCMGNSLWVWNNQNSNEIFLGVTDSKWLIARSWSMVCSVG